MPNTPNRWGSQQRPGKVHSGISAGNQPGAIIQNRNIEAYLNTADELQARGRLDEAIANYRKAISINPSHPYAHGNMGVALQAQGKLDEAVTSYLKAISLRPDFANAHYNLANTLAAQGRFDKAIASYRNTISIRPDFADAHFNLGNALRLQGKGDEAVSSYRAVLLLDPNHAEAYNNMGSTLQAQGKLEEAIACYRKALALRPNHFRAYNNLGYAFQSQGKLDEAISSYHKALSLRPDYAEAHINLGSALKGQGHFGAAIESYRRAIALKPGLAEAHSNLGNALKDQGDLDAAIECFRKAIALKPDFSGARNNLGTALVLQGKLEEAIENYHAALSINPDYSEAHGNLGIALKDLGDLNAAVEHHKKAISLRPDRSDAHSNLLFCLNYHPDMPAEDIYAEYRRWNVAHAQPLRQQEKPHDNERTPDRRLRIGYVSPDLRKHPVCHFIEPLLAHHDKAAVEVFAYAEVITEDAVSARLKGYVDHWLNTVGMSDDTLAETIRRDGIDILVDLAGHTEGNRLLVFARKPAPIQVSWLGYGYTTGLDAMDYLLADAEFGPPGCNALFSENLVRLPAITAYHPAEGMGEPGPLPALQSAAGITFGSLSRSVRINHRVIRTWAAILKRLPGSRLMINSGNFRSDGLRANVHAQFAAHGVAANRVELGFESPPWDVLRKIDISLDCFPHNSGTTLYESLYLGVPYITLAERPSVGRIGSSALRGIGHPEWIAATEQEYVDKAVALASDLDKLATLRATLRAQMQSSAWMDEPAFARSVEAAYRIMWQRWCDGLPAAHIETSELHSHQDVRPDVALQKHG